MPDPVLRGVESADRAFLYHVASQWPETWPRVCQKGIPSPHEFESMLWSGTLAQYLVSVRIGGDEIPVGLVGLYDADHIGMTKMASASSAER